ncbi:glycosyltransferase family 4 protein [Macellibacteroides fermentans]|uniref:Colanic acid biosynthesis glycosyl transferase WcaI n=1 Tax=Parabacteroides chartae TaxID=1037355 RepID=A0A1T5AP56_9BACT|nr:glycosyltransferase family 4 protein [Parabacteroides chartae]SKB36655.1 colanic acid biosynthesis glycosyl transferase WcaI [Parabacteroides chartae]
MILLTLTSYFYPENISSSHLNNNLNEAYASSNIKQIVVTPSPCRGISEELRIEYKNKEHEVELYHNGMMEVYRFSMFKEGTNVLLRAFRYTLICCKQLYYGITLPKIDTLFLASTPPIQGAIGSIIKKVRKIPFIYNLQDIFPDSMVGTGLTNKNSIVWIIGRLIENFTYKHADKIIVISEDFKKNIMAKGVPEEKIVVVYNWVDQNAVVNVPREENKLFDKYKLDRDAFYITYSGNIGLTQNMDLLLDLMNDLQKSYPKIKLVLVGEGAYKKNVEEIVKQGNLNNVTMIPFQDYADISQVFSLGDAGLVISKPGVGSNSVPSKTWSIMSASRPVIANFDENELKSIIADNECGIFTKAGDKEAFKNAIITLYENKEKAVQMGKNGREFVMKNLTREVGTQKYVDVIKDVVNNRKQ